MNAREHPLLAIPLKPPGIEEIPCGKGLRLSRCLDEASPVRKFLAKVFGPRRREAELDELGARFWQAVDGRSSLRRIAARLSRQWGTAPKETEDALLAFTRSLMLRNLLALRLRTPRQ